MSAARERKDGGDGRGHLTTEEQAEYGYYVSYSTFVAILKSKACQLLANSSGV